MGTISVSVLFPAHQAKLVALVASAPDPWWSTRLPRDLLLLPQGLLPRFLSRSAGLRGRRGPLASLSRRDRIPTYSAKPASLLPLPRAHFPDHSLVRRHSRVLV